MAPKRPAGYQKQEQKGMDVKSPEIYADGRVCFRLWAPGAKQVILCGSWIAGSLGVWLEEKGHVAMEKGGDGVWNVTVGAMAAGIHTYRFSLDGAQIIDPVNPAIMANETNSSSLLEVPGDEALADDIGHVPHGAVHIERYWSSTLAVLRTVYVYTPPGYQGVADKFPVLYLLHGTAGFESNWTAVGRANFILDNLIAVDRARPMVVVMPYGRAYPNIKPSDGSIGYWPNIQLFEKDLISDIMPLIEAGYRVRTDRENTAIAGLSGGGGQALAIGLGNLDRFAWIGGLSSAMWANEFDRNFAAAREDPERVNRMLRLLWFACGDEDHVFEDNQAFAAWLTELGVKHIFRETDGWHTWLNWRLYLAELAPLLFREQY